MKTIKAITHYANCLFVASTFLLALIYGEQALSAYFILGVFQIIISLVITMACTANNHNGKQVFMYWLFVAGYFLGVMPICIHYKLEAFGLLFFPMLIAIYNCYLTYIMYKRP